MAGIIHTGGKMAGGKIIMDGCIGIFEFEIGKFGCIAIRDSLFIEDPTQLFPQIISSEINKVSYQHEKKFEMICLVVDTGKNVVLIDTGWGPGRDPNAGKLIEGLHNIGISCSEIDSVIHTHGHPDHIGGNADVDNGPVFQNARYVMCRNEWEYWTSDPELEHVDPEKKKDMLEFAGKHLISIRDNFDIVNDDAEIFPGIKCIKTPGHTPGHTSFVISSGDTQLVCAGDVVHHPIQLLKPAWPMLLDTTKDQGKVNRIRILERASGTNTVFFACHFPFPGVGDVVKNNDVWLWYPYEGKDKSA
jgi:glyoxylase-like metal-dependent hydrolase (beta-lactamase superfamily II)